MKDNTTTNVQLENGSPAFAKPVLSAASFNWVSVYIQKPNEGQKVASRISNEQGYVGECIYTNGYFETYREHRNRIEITRWKHDEWAAL